MILRPYPKYRDPALTWLSRIPEHWKTKRTKHVFRERIQKGFPNEPLLVASQNKGVIPKTDYGLRTVEALKDFHLLKLVECGDYVISLRSFQGGIEYSHHRGIISPAYTVLTPSQEARREYFQFLFKSAPFISALTLFVTGIREGQNIDYERLSRSPLPFPPDDEQVQIGRYLGDFTLRVDRLITAKRNLVELLNEQKQAITNRVLTRGLCPDAPVKASGIPWFGDIPQRWQVKPIKYFFKEVDERSATGAEELLSVSHITGVTPRSQKNITMFKANSYVGYKLCSPGDLVINTMWAWMAALGVSKYRGIVSTAYNVYRPIKPAELFEDYADLLLRTQPYRSEYLCRSTGIRASRLRLYPEQFLRLKLACPSKPEQHAIVDHVTKETASLSTQIIRAEREIELIREYRTRFVADVVTGQLDVREAARGLTEARQGDAAPVPEAMEEIAPTENELFEEVADEG